MKTKKIVCPIDFSEASEKALDVASKLARANGAKMYIMHVEELASLVHPGLLGGLPPVTLPSRRKLNSTLPTATEVRFEHDLLIGNPAEKIVEFAIEKGADLIVMGTHGNTGMTRVLMGSVAEGVVRRSPIPVLTLKADFEDTPQNSGNEAKKETNKEAEGDTGKPAGATT